MSFWCWWFLFHKQIIERTDPCFMLCHGVIYTQVLDKSHLFFAVPQPATIFLQHQYLQFPQIAVEAEHGKNHMGWWTHLRTTISGSMVPAISFNDSPCLHRVSSATLARALASSPWQLQAWCRSTRRFTSTSRLAVGDGFYPLVN